MRTVFLPDCGIVALELAQRVPRAQRKQERKNASCNIRTFLFLYYEPKFYWLWRLHSDIEHLLRNYEVFTLTQSCV